MKVRLYWSRQTFNVKPHAYALGPYIYCVVGWGGQVNLNSSSLESLEMEGLADIGTLGTLILQCILHNHTDMQVIFSTIHLNSTDIMKCILYPYTYVGYVVHIFYNTFE